MTLNGNSIYLNCNFLIFRDFCEGKRTTPFKYLGGNEMWAERMRYKTLLTLYYQKQLEFLPFFQLRLYQFGSLFFLDYCARPIEIRADQIRYDLWWNIPATEHNQTRWSSQTPHVKILHNWQLTKPKTQINLAPHIKCLRKIIVPTHTFPPES